MNKVRVEELSRLDLNFLFLEAILAEPQWSEDGSVIVCKAQSPYFRKKTNLTFESDGVPWRDCVNLFDLIEVYGVEISVDIDTNTNLKTFSCKTLNTKDVFFSKDMVEALMQAVVNWRFGGHVCPREKNVIQKVSNNIPLDSLALSMAALLALKRKKINSILDLKNYNFEQLKILLDNNEEVASEIQLKLKQFNIIID